MSRTVCNWRGDFVRARREARRLSVTEVAAAIGVRENTLSRYEAGNEPRGMSVLVRLAVLLDCEVEDFFDRVEGGAA